jgi:hypothetical protein
MRSGEIKVREFIVEIAIRKMEKLMEVCTKLKINIKGLVCDDVD